MIFDNPPRIPDGYTQLIPEIFNENLLAAKSQIEDLARHKYRDFDISFPVSTNTNQFELPLIASTQYIIDRITITGTYTGQPTIYYKLANETEARTFILPANGYDGATYTGVIAVGQVMDGITGSPASHSNNFICTSSAAITNLRFTVTLRTSRLALGSTASTLDLDLADLWIDGETASPTKHEGHLTLLQLFETTNSPTSSHPRVIYATTFTNITSTTPLALSQDNIPGRKAVRLRRLLSVIEMDTAGSAGQTVTIDCLVANASNSHSVSVDAVTTARSSSGSITNFDDTRGFTSSLNDLVIRVTTNGTSTIKKAMVFAVCEAYL